MAEECKIVYQGGEGEIVEKKSRFIATVVPVGTEEEALSFIEATRKKYWDARHNCFAYVIGERNELARCSDDGEPQGTAGKPMLDVLLGNGIHNAAVVVTRYFGGVLLWRSVSLRGYTLSKGYGRFYGADALYSEFPGELSAGDERAPAFFGTGNL